jgi:hypothetical protein
MHLWLGNLKEKGGSRFATLLLFPCVTGEVGRKYVRYLQATKCNMITNKQTNLKEKDDTS